MSEQTETFEGYAIIELFGHNMIAGLVTEQSIGGSSFVRVDVPRVNGNEPFTKFYGCAAIYAITPTTQELAEQAAAKLSIRPVTPWVVPDRVKEIAPPHLGLGDEYCSCGHTRQDHSKELGCVNCKCQEFTEVTF